MNNKRILLALILCVIPLTGCTQESDVSSLSSVSEPQQTQSSASEPQENSTLSKESAAPSVGTKLEIGSFESGFNLEDVNLLGLSGDYLYYYKNLEASDTPNQEYFCYQFSTQKITSLGELRISNVCVPSKVTLGKELFLMQDDFSTVKTIRLCGEDPLQVTEAPSKPFSASMFYNQTDTKYALYWFDLVSQSDCTAYLEQYTKPGSEKTELLTKHYDESCGLFNVRFQGETIYLLEQDKSDSMLYLCQYDAAGTLVSRNPMTEMKQILDEKEDVGVQNLNDFWVVDDFLSFSTTTSQGNSIVKLLPGGKQEVVLPGFAFLTPDAAVSPDQKTHVIYEVCYTQSGTCYHLCLLDTQTEQIREIADHVQNMTTDGKTLVYCGEDGAFYSVSLGELSKRTT